MRIAPILAALCTALICTAGAARAEDIRATFDVRLLGLSVGKMQFAAREGAGSYAVNSVFGTAGVGRIVNAGFRLSSAGSLRQGRLMPQTYDEQIDTGSRRSTASLRYDGGVPRITGGTVVSERAEDPQALDVAAQGGTVDPLTALWGVLRDRPAEGLCRYDTLVFDGQRRARLAMTGRSDAGGRTTCTGAYTRIGGFTASEMRKQTVFPFAVTYVPAGAAMRAQTVTVKSGFGLAEMTRE